MQNTGFNWHTFINMVDNLSHGNLRMQLSELEKLLLKCYWYGMNHQEILKVLNENRSNLKHYYNDNYFCMGFEPNLMKKLSDLVSHPVNKNNFREVYQLIWERNQSNAS